MKRVKILLALVATLGFLIYGCGDDRATEPAANIDDPELEFSELMSATGQGCQQSAPTPLVNISHDCGQSLIWPFTGENFSGSPQDPINLIFVGKADPRDIRAALLNLDGDRSALGFPAVEPFTSTWDDAIGDVQVAFGEANQRYASSRITPAADEGHGPGNVCGWTGGAIQLACGSYEQLRVHLRLFDIGNCTVANAHFEAMIPGTEQHQVLSWELAEQLVVADFIRSGLIDLVNGPSQTDFINPSPFREIPQVIYNELPEDLKMLIGGPTGQVSSDVPIATDGHATVLYLVDNVVRVPETRNQNLTIYYDRVVPKPFCSAGPGDYIYVNGEIHMSQSAILNSVGHFEVEFAADGNLTVTPVDPISGEIVGEPMTAFVRERHNGRYNDRNCFASSVKFQRLGRGNDEAGGRFFSRLICNSNGNNSFHASVKCSNEPEVGGDGNWEDEFPPFDGKVKLFGTR